MVVQTRLGFKRIIYPVQQCANSAAPRPSKSCHDREVVHRFPKTGMKSGSRVSTHAPQTKTVLLSDKKKSERSDVCSSRIDSRVRLNALRSVLISWRVAAVWALARSPQANILTRSGMVVSLRHQYKPTRSLKSSANPPFFTTYTFAQTHRARVVNL